jgi:hypothetical protein
MLIIAAGTKNHRQTHPTPPVIPKQSILLYSDLLVTGHRFRSSFPLLFRRNPLKHKIVSSIFYWFCMMGNPSQEAKGNSLLKGGTSAIKLKIPANWATDSSGSFHTCSDWNMAI